MTRDVVVAPLTAEAFAAYGEVLEAAGAPTVMINRGKCGRYDDLARLAFDGPGGRPAISIFDGQPYDLPLELEMMERHPLGSQAFIPMSEDPFLVIVADDRDGAPDRPRAFQTGLHQGVNYHRGVWHGVLTPLGRVARFAVVDRVGAGTNLEEHWFEQPYRVVRRP